MFVLDIPKTGSGGAAGARQKRVHLAPNPAWLRVNEVTIGVSSSDALFDLSGDEVSAGGQGTNRLARLAGHLLQQQSFYPLFPPPAGSAAQLDMRHAQRWGMPTTPDVLLVPSRLAQFAREVQVGWTLSFFLVWPFFFVFLLVSEPCCYSSACLYVYTVVKVCLFLVVHKDGAFAAVVDVHAHAIFLGFAFRGTFTSLHVGHITTTGFRVPPSAPLPTPLPSISKL